MARTVEVIGASGVGKTTIYNQLKEEWEPNNTWVPFDYLKHSRDKILKRYFKKLFFRFIPLMLNKKESMKNASVSDQWRFIEHDNKTFLSEDFSDFKTTVMNLIDEHCREGYDGSDKRFKTIYMMMWSIAYIETVKSIKNDNRLCILKQGEGLVSRIMHLNTPSFDEDALMQYLDVVPFPDHLILLDVHPDEIMRRIKNRGRVSTLHHGMDSNMICEFTKKTMEYLKIASEAAEKKGSNVHRINATLTSETQTAKKIVEILAS